MTRQKLDRKEPNIHGEAMRFGHWRYGIGFRRFPVTVIGPYVVRTLQNYCCIYVGSLKNTPGRHFLKSLSNIDWSLLLNSEVALKP